MRSFKEQLTADLNIFMNLEEFGVLVEVEGTEITAIVDDDKLSERKGGAEIAIGESSILLIAKTADLPKRKGNGSALNVDGREYTVDDWQESMGISTIALSQSISA